MFALLGLLASIAFSGGCRYERERQVYIDFHESASVPFLSLIMSTPKEDKGNSFANKRAITTCETQVGHHRRNC